MQCRASDRPGFQESATPEALSLIQEVRQRFVHDRDVYERIISALQSFKNGRLQVRGFSQLLEQQLRDHRDLLQRFNQFLPEGHRIKLGREKRESKQKRTRFGDLRPEVAQRAKRTRKRLGDLTAQECFDHSVDLIRGVKAAFRDDPESCGTFLRAMHNYFDSQTNVSGLLEEVAGLLHCQPHLLGKFRFFLDDQPEALDLLQRCIQRVRAFAPQQRKQSGTDAEQREVATPEADSSTDSSGDLEKDHVLQREMGFLRRMKGSLRSSQTYKSFLKVLNLFSLEVISREQLEPLVDSLLGQNESLADQFRDFLRRCDRLGADLEGSDKDQPFLKLKQALGKKKDYDKRPVAELDTSNMERCTPSYLILPHDYPKLVCTGRTRLGDRVLNDFMVSIPSGSEDSGSKQIRKNQFEENLFRIEETMCELDVSLHRNGSTLKVLEDLKLRLDALPEEQRATFDVPANLLSPVQTRVISNLYGGRGTEMLRLLKDSTATAVDVIIKRVQQKQDEWCTLKAEVRQQWQKTFDENYTRSLDHHSLIFKQADKKQLASRALVQEIQDVAEKGMGSDVELRRSFGSLAPDDEPCANRLMYSFPDESVWPDVIELLAHTNAAVLSVREGDKVLRLWRRVVQPFLGLPQLVAPEAVAHEAAPPAQPTEGSAPQPEVSGETDNETDSGCAREGDGQQDAAAFGGCRPLSLSYREPQSDAGAEAAEAKVERPRDAGAEAAKGTESSRVLYCTEPLYLVFRLVQVAYERLLMAKQLSADHGRSQFRQTGEPTPVVDNAAVEKAAADGHAARRRFLSATKALVSGSLQAVEFEDLCRAALGNNAYFLFTVDRLMDRLVRQLRLAATDPGTLQVVDLYEYHGRLVTGGGRQDAVYLANARMLTQHEDHIFRVQAWGSCRLSVQLMDWAAKLLPLPLHYEEKEGGISAYVASEPSLPDTPPVFLRSALRRGKLLDGRRGTLVVDNSLESWFSEAEGGRICFEAGTADFLIRRRPRRKGREALRHQLQAKFSAWVEARRVQLAQR